jgi:enediyne biosynthesis protein E4
VTSTTRRVQMVKTGSSYLSQSELALTVGLGAARSSNKIDIAWPSGRVERLPAIDAGQTVVIEEGRGVVSGTPFTPRPAPPTTGLRR